jgi:hypothetical protein
MSRTCPSSKDIELIEEHARVERRPSTRLIAEEELAAGGLLQERVIEVAQMREEAVVNKQAFVREEVVVSKSVERRVERIDETVRRTEVEVDRLEGERPAFFRPRTGSHRPESLTGAARLVKESKHVPNGHRFVRHPRRGRSGAAAPCRRG